jgi:alpha-glucosidase (family GH31 glycosyl hydrolase)
VENKCFSQLPSFVFASESGQLDFFLMIGRAPADIFAQYAALTGRGRLPQMFAIAYHQVWFWFGLESG